MADATALVTDDATTQPVEVRFLNLVSGGSAVRSRMFESQAAFATWLDRVRDMVEVVSVTDEAAA